MADMQGLTIDWGAMGRHPETGMPLHLPILLTEDGEGPATGDDMHHMGCWCASDYCPLGLALKQAFTLGQECGAEHGHV